MTPGKRCLVMGPTPGVDICTRDLQHTAEHQVDPVTGVYTHRWARKWRTAPPGRCANDKQVVGGHELGVQRYQRPQLHGSFTPVRRHGTMATGLDCLRNT
jgi:hypothetical protein